MILFAAITRHAISINHMLLIFETKIDVVAHVQSRQMYVRQANGSDHNLFYLPKRQLIVRTVACKALNQFYILD